MIDLNYPVFKVCVIMQQVYIMTFKKKIWVYKCTVGFL